MMPNNKTILSFSKVSYCDYFFANQYGDTATKLPSMDTLFGHSVDPADKLYKSEETKLAAARRTGLIDKWIAQCKFQLSNNHSITYTGDKATSMYKAWCAHVFGGKKSNKKKKKDQ